MWESSSEGGRTFSSAKAKRKAQKTIIPSYLLKPPVPFHQADSENLADKISLGKMLKRKKIVRGQAGLVGQKPLLPEQVVE